MEVIPDTRTSGFDHGTGPGVYDIHSARVPTIAVATKLLRTTLASIAARQLQVNLD
jgi:5-methyltetrahydropteroyltriglutamate--homocysteine methyltransferase